MAGCLFMALLIGVLIPSAVISDSPMDFVTLTNYQSPLKILIYSVLTAAGTFLFWSGIFYYLADGKGRVAARCPLRANRSMSLLPTNCWNL